MGAGRSLNTWGKHGRFTYAGDLARGTRVTHGHGETFVVPSEVYGELLRAFGGREVAIGLSLRPARASLGAFLAARLGRQGLAAYVGPILVAEGAAERVDARTIRLGSSHVAPGRDDATARRRDAA